jgi:hypothetical protein
MKRTSKLHLQNASVIDPLPPASILSSASFLAICIIIGSFPFFCRLPHAMKFLAFEIFGWKFNKICDLKSFLGEDATYYYAQGKFNQRVKRVKSLPPFSRFYFRSLLGLPYFI